MVFGLLSMNFFVGLNKISSFLHSELLDSLLIQEDGTGFRVGDPEQFTQ
jgi:hypothetical protein